MTPICISQEDRDLLYNRILLHLSGIDAVWLAVRNRDYETVHVSAVGFCDELQLVMDDLGLGERVEEPIELTSPPDVVQRVIEHLMAMAAGEGDERHPGALREASAENRRLRAICEELLAALDRLSAGSGAESA